MKKFTLTLLLALFVGMLSIFSQNPPEAFNYQTVLRNASGELISGQTVGIEFTILRNGIKTYAETHTATTNSLGLINLVIGEGTVTLGDFSSIDWSSGTYTISTGIDETGGTDFEIFGTSSLLSVPFALYAKNSGNN